MVSDDETQAHSGGCIVELLNVETVLRSLQPDHDGVDADIGIRDGAAYLQMKKTGRPDRWAVIWSPGDRWFALDVDGGFSLNHFDEELPDDEVRSLLEKYVEIGLAYVLGVSVPTSAGRFKARVLRVTTEDGDFDLRLNVGAALKDALGLRRRERPNLRR
jgi:hypothetical protein